MLLATGIFHDKVLNLIKEINEVQNFLEKDKISYPSFNHITTSEKFLEEFLEEYYQILMQRI